MRAMPIALALIVASSAAPALADPQPGHVITPPGWVAPPTPDTMQRYYPIGAARLRVSGSATITCLVRLTGHVTDCRIASEDPVGYGFGEAAVQMADTFAMRPKLIDGAPVDGATVNIPINFRLPPKTWAQRMGIIR